jgi:hypothetical protein
MLARSQARRRIFCPSIFRKEIAMRALTLSAIAAIVLSISSASAAPLSPAGISRSVDQSAIVLVQDKKNETIKQKAKRIWRDLTGYKFSVGCPALLTVSRTTCTETGKNREEARAKCQSRNPFCAVADAR